MGEALLVKEDMSSKCGLSDHEMWYRYHVLKSISKDTYFEWYSSNCCVCIYGGYTCLYESIMGNESY